MKEEMRETNLCTHWEKISRGKDTNIERLFSSLSIHPHKVYSDHSREKYGCVMNAKHK